MSNLVHNLVLGRKVGSSTRKAVLLYMAGRASDDGSGVWSSKPRMARELEFTKNSILKAVRELICMGLISEVGKRPCSSGHTIVYNLNLQSITALEPTDCQIESLPVNIEVSHHRGVQKMHAIYAIDKRQEAHDVHPNHPLTIQEPSVAKATSDLDLVFFEEFAAAFPRIGNLKKTEAALRVAIADGASPEVILAGAKAYAVEQAGNQTRYIAFSENWVTQARWVQFEKTAADPAKAAIVTEGWVKAIKSGHQSLARHCSVGTARELIARNMVTHSQCREMGIQI
ncbi:hypothetical protein O4H61_09165 [Roseovarius aestuarii]|nr:hypothetical protein [Roseovarius aestuarii]